MFAVQPRERLCLASQDIQGQEFPLTDNVSSRSQIATASASRYLQQLCKHFEHKIPVTFDPNSGSITFSSGVCAVAADDTTLTLSLTSANAEDMATLKDVVARHLVRFAFREDLTVAWED